MTAAGLYFSLLVAVGLGLIFHFIRGGGIGRLILYLAAAWIAFIAGHLVAELLELHILRVGPINLFAAVLASVVGLLAASVLVGPERPGRRSRDRGRKG